MAQTVGQHARCIPNCRMVVLVRCMQILIILETLFNVKLDKGIENYALLLKRLYISKGLPGAIWWLQLEARVRSKRYKLHAKLDTSHILVYTHHTTNYIGPRYNSLCDTTS